MSFAERAQKAVQGSPQTAVVHVDGLVVLKILKHCRDSLPQMAAGTLLGLDRPQETHDVLTDFEGLEHDLTTHEAAKALTLLLQGNGNVLERLLSSHQQAALSYRAAEVVNALADTYVLQTAENKRSATNRASDWLERRAEEVRSRMVEAESSSARTVPTKLRKSSERPAAKVSGAAAGTALRQSSRVERERTSQR